jgi:hyperosmotically inducible protein
MDYALKFLAVSAVVIALAIAPSVFAANQPDASPSGASAKDETAVQYMDDAIITARIKAMLFTDTGLKSSNISVRTTQGIVRMTGTVETRVEKKRAMSIAQNTQGVKSIKDDIVVRNEKSIR